jgi:hypothetical protein
MPPLLNTLNYWYKKLKKNIFNIFDWNEKPKVRKEEMKVINNNFEQNIKFNINLPYLGDEYMQLKEPIYLKEPLKIQTFDNLSDYLAGFKVESQFRIELKKIIAKAKAKFGQVNNQTLKEKSKDAVWQTRQSEIQAIEKALAVDHRLNDQKNIGRIYDDSELIKLCALISENTEMTMIGYIFGENDAIHETRKLLDKVKNKKCQYFANSEYILKYNELNIQELHNGEAIKKRDEIIAEQKEEITGLRKENDDFREKLTQAVQVIQDNTKHIEEMRGFIVVQDIQIKDLNKKLEGILSFHDEIKEDFKKLQGDHNTTYKNGQRDTMKFFKFNGKRKLAVQETNLSCPLSQMPFVNPVVADDGHTYEKEEILKYFKKLEEAKKPIISPVTREKMSKTLRPAFLAKHLVSEMENERQFNSQIPVSSEDESYFTDNTSSVNKSPSSSYRMNGFNG